jgi:TatD DNase family protein
MPLVDTHAHLNDPKYESDIDQVISRAIEAKVEKIIVCGSDIHSSRLAVNLAAKYPAIYATVGVHPHESKLFEVQSLRLIEELARRPKVVAIGEIGLDFHYDLSPRARQMEAFEAQLSLADKLNLPVILHSRAAEREVLNVLAGPRQKMVRGVLHCFGGDEAQADEALSLGLHIGVDGPVTFKTSARTARVVNVCPLDRILLETDCPYLTPEPHRGHRNEPAFLLLIAKRVAEIKGTSFTNVVEQTTRNAEALFKL